MGCNGVAVLQFGDDQFMQMFIKLDEDEEWLSRYCQNLREHSKYYKILLLLHININ